MTNFVLRFFRTSFFLLTSISIIGAQAAQMSSLPTPPVAKKVPKTTEIHGKKLVDNYFWLREKPNPEVKAYVEAENVYADAVMKASEPLQKQLYDEMLRRIKETDTDVPYQEGESFYYTRTETGKQYGIRCRKKGSIDAAEEIILDINELAVGKTFMSVAAFRPSPDGNLLAYSTDSTGFRQYSLAIKDMRTGKLLPDHAEKTGSVVWSADNQTLFYTVEDPAKRQYRLYRHKLGSTGPDDLVYEEKDEKFGVSAYKSRDDAYIFLVSSSHTTSEARYIPANQPTADWKLLEPRKHEVEYYPDHHGNSFYIRTNDTGRNFRLVEVPVANPGRANWKEVIAHRPDVMLGAIDIFKDYFVTYEREHGLPQISVSDFAGGKPRRLEFPEPAYLSAQYTNHVFDTPKFRYTYQSYITPQSVFEYDVPSGKSTLLKQKEVPGGYDPTRYQVEQLYAPASDGAKIPISVVYLKTLKRDGTEPLFLYGYGSYGIPIDITFTSNLFSLVDRGVVVAISHIRGGGELGKPWHDDGRMMKKKNTFTDFIASAEYLLSNGYGTKDKLVIEGGSAGGLLMGAVTNMRPDLFKAVVSKVPFVDVINTMLDESLPLTVGEFEEWGNPKEKPAFDYMMSYSPYDNLQAKAYPNIMVKTSFNDSQVMYWEPAKYVAKLRTLKTDKNLLLLKTNMGAGHGGASGRYDSLKEAAYEYAFILNQMGIEK